MTVTPTADDPLATITVNGAHVASGAASGAIRLNTDITNVITTVVVSADKTATNIYTLAVNRTDSAIYEPFNYPAGSNLLGQAVGPNTGLVGSWFQGPVNYFQTAAIAAGSLGFPGYPTTANHVVPAVNNTDVTMVANVGPNLAAAGLLAPGATLWYSALVLAENNAGGITRQTYLGIGSGWADGFSRYGPSGASTYSGLGMTVVGLTAYAQGWDGPANKQSQGTAATIPAGVNLIVGKITWSPTAGSGYHTNSIYVVGSGLALPASPASTFGFSAADFNQSYYTNISFAGGGSDGDLPQIDEIRFGASYAAVIGLQNPAYWDLNGTTAGSGSATPTGTWDATAPNWNLASDGTGATAAWTPGQSAVFSAGADATGAYTVTVNGMQDIGGLVFNAGTVTLAKGTAGDLRMVANARVTVASGVTATVQTPISDDGKGEVMSTGGAGMLDLSGNNSAATGGMALFGPTRFESPSALNGTAQNIAVNSGGVLVFGPSFGAANIQNTLNTRLVANSPGTIAVDNYPTTPFDFNAAGLTACSLGAVGTVTYTGTLTPNGGTLRIGGGGGTVILANANSVSGNNSLVINGNLTLGAANNYAGGTTLNAGTLIFGQNGSFGAGGLTLNASALPTAPTIQSADSTAHAVANAFAIGGNINFGATNTGDLTFTDTAGCPLANVPILTINNTNTTIAQVFSGSGSLTKAGTGNLILTGNSTFTNLTTLAAGTLTITNLPPSSTPSPIGAWPFPGQTSPVAPTALANSGAAYNAPKGLSISGGTLVYAGPSATTDRGFYLTGVATINVTNPGTALTLGQCGYNVNGALTIVGGAGSSLSIGPVPNNGTANYIANIPLTIMQFNVNGRTITLNGTAVGSRVPGPIYCNGGTGAITKSGTGTWILSGINQYNGATTVSAGTLQFAQVAALPYGLNGMPALTPTLLPVASGATLALNVGGTGEFATADLDNFMASMSASTATAGFKSGSALGLDTSNAGGSFTPDSPLTLGTGTVGLTKLGTGSLVLNFANPHSGPTLIAGGTLALGSGGSIANTPRIDVQAGSVFDVSAGAFTLGSAQTLMGNGTVVGAVTVNGTVSPGESVGTLYTGSQTWNGGATNRFEVSSAANSAGRDLLNITGTLNVQATSDNPFTIKLASMTNTTTAGLVPDFNANTFYTWTIATASGGILNFDASKFAISTSGFSNAYTGTFSVTTNGNSLVVNYSALLQTPTLSGFGPLSGTSFPLTFSGPSGQTYKVLSSTNVALPLGSWTVLSSGTFGANPATFTDTSATNTQQFYRIKSP